MSDPRPSAVNLTIPACTCPGTPHPDGDTATFRSHLTWDGGIAAATALNRARRAGTTESDAVLERELGIVLVAHGLTEWNLVDENGPRPISEDSIRAVPWSPTGYALWDRATDLYAAEALDPLGMRLSKPSLNGQTAPSTSATSGGRAKPRKRSGSSSRRALADTAP